jgi:uncharacterized NAD(P)/FAD-binding protein YdhS
MQEAHTMFQGPSRRLGPTDCVVIVGAGFSGSLQAIDILRHGGPRTILVERRSIAGRGTAYLAPIDDHLLNVRAGNMSAFPDDPEHFTRWLEARGLGDASDFIPRRTYGTYLSEMLAEAAAGSDGRLTILCDEAVDAAFEGEQVTVSLASGRELHADALILAVGNLPPQQPPGLDGDALGSDFYAPDPWADGLAEGLADADEVLILGSGLTMVDAVLLLEARGYKGRITALSRRGLLPRAHKNGGAAAFKAITERPSLSPSALVAAVRSRAELLGWRAAVDELRPFTQALWLASSRTERRRFLRHLRPWWDVHRHRLAPRVAERIAAMMESGRLRVVAGKLTGAVAEEGAATVRWRPRGSDGVQSLRVRKIINCTGPQSDLARTGEPLLRNLLDKGRIRPDAEHLGIDVNQQAEVVAADGTVQPRLLAIGPMTKGAFWEIVAVPDIRVQSAALARRMSNAHWIEGEGL